MEFEKERNQPRLIRARVRGHRRAITAWSSCERGAWSLGRGSQGLPSWIRPVTPPILPCVSWIDMCSWCLWGSLCDLESMLADQKFTEWQILMIMKVHKIICIERKAAKCLWIAQKQHQISSPRCLRSQQSKGGRMLARGVRIYTASARSYQVSFCTHHDLIKGSGSCFRSHAPNRGRLYWACCSPAVALAIAQVIT